MDCGSTMIQIRTKRRMVIAPFVTRPTVTGVIRKWRIKLRWYLDTGTWLKG